MPTQINAARKAEIAGWGADLDTADRPAHPRERSPARFTHAHWVEPPRQIPRVKILVSTEHKAITPVFGTSCPPSGVSGLIRELAFKYRESQKNHWLLLMLADRVNVWEATIGDILRAKPDNPISEMGLKAEFTRGGIRSRFGQNRYDTVRQGQQLALAGGIAIAGYLAFRAIRKR